MARAKRFDRDRAEARRRYRASLAATPPGEDDATDDSPAAEDPADAPARSTSPSPGRRATLRGSPSKATPPQPEGRLSLAQAFRTAFRPANLAEDLRTLPKLLLHKAVWGPIVVSAISVLLFIVTGPKNVVAAFAFNTFGLPPALAAVFITGFFVPRASYLVGGIVATVAAVFYSIFVVMASQGVVPEVQAIAADRVPAEIAGAFSIGPVSGVVFGAAAAWYRRFLYLSSPKRTSSRPGSTSGRRSGSTGRLGSRRR